MSQTAPETVVVTRPDIELVGGDRLRVITSDTGGRFYLAMRTQSARSRAFERQMVWLRVSHRAREAS